jgi:hypothetical protein
VNSYIFVIQNIVNVALYFVLHGQFVANSEPTHISVDSSC